MTAERLAIFDLDGTLLDSLPDLADCARELLAEYHLPPQNDLAVRSMIGDGVAALVSRLLDAGGKDAVHIDREEACARYMALYEPRTTRLSRLFPFIRETLDALHATRWKLAVCTNKPERAARAILEQYDLLPMMSAVSGGDSFAVRKPNPHHVMETIRIANGTPSHSIMIGDHRNDILSGNGAGTATIFAAWGYGTLDIRKEASAIADSPRDILPLVNKLIAS